MNKPHRVTVYEVGPRDGLQNLARFVPTDTKVDFINALSAAGLPAVEATSFVAPKSIPQLSDAGEVMAQIKRPEGVRFPALVPNSLGVDLALAAGVEEVAIFIAASETFNRSNLNASIAESIECFRSVAERVREHEGRLRGYIATAFGCPYQGEVEMGTVMRLTGDLFKLGCTEVSIGDTIGTADPDQVGCMVELLGTEFDLSTIALHLHDTYGRGLANALTGLNAGIVVFDAAAGGLGGCPYAPGASGNLATEDLVAMLHQLGIETGVDLPALVEASSRLAEVTGLQPPSRALAALTRCEPVLA